MKLKFLLSFMLWTSVFYLFGNPPTAKISILKGAPPKIDGKVDAKGWAGATVLKDFVISGKDRKAVNQTEVYLLRDKNVLYLAAKCFDAEMENFSGKDWFELFLADSETKIYYHFYVFSNGGKGQDGSPGVFLFGAPHWQGKTSRHKDRWEVEIAIPFYNLSSEYMNTDAWKLNICRQKISGNKENSQWSDTGGYFHVPEKFGTLTGMKELNFVPSVAVSQMIHDEKTEDYKLPSYFLLDRSYYTRERQAQFKLFIDTKTLTTLNNNAKFTVSLGAKTVSLPVNTNREKFYGKINIEKLEAGTHKVSAVLADGKIRKEFTTELIKLLPVENEVKINRFTRLLMVNGKPFIPLICEIMPHGTRLPDPVAPPNALEILCRDSGFNTLSFWWTHSVKGMPICAAQNVKVIPALVDIMASRPPREEKYRKVVTEFSREPNLLAYLIADEGNIGKSEEEFSRTYRFVKSLDPYRPVFRNESGWTIGYGGPGGLDTTDIFCGGYGGAKSARAISIDAVPRGAPVFLLTVAFGIPEEHRYISARETICWVYQILINGATGAFWWGAHSGQQPIPFWKTITQLRKEIDMLTPVFNTEEIRSSTNCKDENITYTLRFHDGKYYLITVNLTDVARETVFMLDSNLFPLKGNACDLFSAGNFTYENLALELQYEPSPEDL